jgi:hypothetical protein
MAFTVTEEDVRDLVLTWTDARWDARLDEIKP